MYEAPKGSATLPRIAEDVVPIGELKAHLAERIRDVRANQRPLVVTQNGKATAVIMSPEEFDRLTGEARFIAAVHDGLAEADAGTTLSHAEVVTELDARAGKRAKRGKMT
ncbi:MAG: type II toxin-antitoxin system Phd/YefM family antitoxin [Deltaproteobacteria bacterium]|nr:type II toxin-antitoxin system Phd/YefM family antitoxin [Deltaproteobacteria bacterium]